MKSIIKSILLICILVISSESFAKQFHIKDQSGSKTKRNPKVTSSMKDIDKSLAPFVPIITQQEQRCGKKSTGLTADDIGVRAYPENVFTLSAYTRLADSYQMVGDLAQTVNQHQIATVRSKAISNIESSENRIRTEVSRYHDFLGQDRQESIIDNLDDPFNVPESVPSSLSLPAVPPAPVYSGCAQCMSDVAQDYNKCLSDIYGAGKVQQCASYANDACTESGCADGDCGAWSGMGECTAFWANQCMAESGSSSDVAAQEQCANQAGDGRQKCKNTNDDCEDLFNIENFIDRYVTVEELTDVKTITTLGDLNSLASLLQNFANIYNDQIQRDIESYGQIQQTTIDRVVDLVNYVDNLQID